MKGGRVACEVLSQRYLATRPCPKGCCAEELKDPGCWAPAEVGARWWFSTQTWVRELALGSGCLAGCRFPRSKMGLQQGEKEHARHGRSG